MTNVLERLTDALAGRYSVESEIGRGGMATVYLAEDVRHRRKVAIKVLHPELASAIGVGRFLKEIEIVAGLTHPHILTLIDSGEADGLLYFVMPFVEGESLRSRLGREKQLPVDDAVRIAREVAEALTYAHERGVVHRDIKPGNILLEEGHAIIADFGVAKALGEAGGEKLTSTGLAVGTPSYMSPEQGTGEQAPDGRTDIYALGCVLYEMLAGDPPFTGATPQVVIKRHSLDPVPSLQTARDTTPESVRVAIEKALSKVPADRFRTADEFAEALTAAPPRAVSRKARRRLQVVTVAAVTAAAMLVLWQFAGWLGLRSGGGSGDVDESQQAEVQLTSTGRVWYAALSPDGGHLAYVESAEPLDRNQGAEAVPDLRIMVKATDETARDWEPRSVVPVQSLEGLDWSPDGQLLAVSGRVRESRGLFLASPFGNQIERLSTQTLYSVDWAPDGRRLVGLTAGLQEITVVERVADGTANVTGSYRIATTYDRLWAVAWSPVDERLVVVADSVGVSTLWLVNPDGSDLQRLVSEDDRILGITWSSRGDVLYYQRQRTGEITRLPLEGASALIAQPLVSDCGYDFSVAAGSSLLACERTAPRNAEIWLKSADETVESVLITRDSVYRSPPVLSPDGRMLAYGRGGDQGEDLYVLALETGQERRLTNRADLGELGSQAWSPDGRFIAYVAPAPDGTSTVWFTPSSGGPSVRAEGVVSNVGLAWSPALDPFVKSPDNRNFQVLDPPVPWDSLLARRAVLTGLTARPLVANDTVGFMFNPVISPDAAHVAVYWNRGDRQAEGSRADAGLWIVSLRDSAQRLLVRQGLSPSRIRPFAWTDDGAGIYMAMGPDIQLVDVATGRTRHIATPGGYCSAVLPDGRLVCVEDVAEQDIWLIRDFDPHNAVVAEVDSAGQQRQEIRLTEHGRVWTPAPAAVSPDGRSVAYLVTDRPRDAGMQLGGSQNLRLMLADLDVGGESSEPRILEVLQEGWDLGWTPDGTHVQVAGVLREATGIFLIPIAGGPYVQLTTRARRPSAWAPDGSRLAVKSGPLEIGFVERHPGGSSEIQDRFAVSAQGHQVMGLAWSPDGRSLALSTDSASISVLWTVSPDGSDLRRLRVEGPIQRIHWSPGGDALYYSRSAPPRELVKLELPAAGGVAGEPTVLATECRYSSVSAQSGSAGCARIQQVDSRFWLRALDPTADSVLLTPEPAQRSRPVMSPDGTQVLYVKDGEEGRDLHVLSLESREELRLTYRGDAGGPAGRAAWSPDGRYIVFIGSSPDGSTSAWIVPSEGGRSVRVENLVAGWDVAWAPGPNPLVQLESRTNWVVLEPEPVSWESALMGRTVKVGKRELAPTDLFSVLSPAISPSGDRVAVYWHRGPTLEDGSRPNSGIWVFSLADLSAELVAGRAPDSPYMFPMRWTRDGSGIYFRRATGIELLDLNTGAISPVATPAGECVTPEPDADGYFLCASVRIDVDAWLIENFDPHVR